LHHHHVEVAAAGRVAKSGFTGHHRDLVTDTGHLTRKHITDWLIACTYPGDAPFVDLLLEAQGARRSAERLLLDPGADVNARMVTDAPRTGEYSAAATSAARSGCGGRASQVPGASAVPH
jgi:hypothetical protein